MRSLRNSLLILLSIYLLSSLTIPNASAQGSTEPTGYYGFMMIHLKHGLRYFLYVGEKFDCYFTIEYRANDHDAGKFQSRIQDVDFDTSIEDWNTLLEHLRVKLPEATVTQDKENPAIVHIAEKSLADVKRYAIETPVSLQYKGTVKNLPQAIAERTGDTLKETSGLLNNSPADYTTRIYIDVRSRPVRNVLSDFLPFCHYNRILWESYCWLHDGKKNVNVEYTSVRIPDVREQQADRVLPFANGSEAYWNNVFSDAIADNATKFIEDGFKKGKTLNVRWAMLYLGKYKVERSLPLLLQHLDYAYTTCPVLDEAYPVLHALLDMGKPAAAAALEALPTETSPLRLKLLCAALMGIHGNYEGRKQARELAARLPEEQKARLLSALSAIDERLIAVPPPWDGKTEGTKEP